VDPETGRYTISGLEAGAYRIQFNVGSYWDEDSGETVYPSLKSEYYDDVTVRDDAEPLVIETGASLEGIDAALAEAAMISGWVALPSGAPQAWLQGVRVVAQPADGAGGDSAYGYVEPETGAYTITGLEKRPYLVHFLAGSYWDNDASAYVYPNLSQEWYKNVRSMDQAFAIDLAKGDRSDINATLEYGSTISGRVALPTGAPSEWLQAVSVYATPYGSSGGSYGSSTVDPETGEYTISGLDAVPYRVQFGVGSYWDADAGMSVSPNLVDEWYKNAHSWDDAFAIDLAQGDRSDISAVLEFGRTISGRVVLPADAPAEWMQSVVVTAQGEDGGRSVSVDPATGEFALDRLLSGRYVVGFQAQPYWDPVAEREVYPNLAPEYYKNTTDLSKAAAIDVSSGDRSGVKAILEYGTTISGTVSVPEGYEGDLDLITVQAVPVSDTGGWRPPTARVDPVTGQYQIGGLLPAKYWVSFYVNGEWDPVAGKYRTPNLVGEMYDGVQDISDATAVDVKSTSQSGIDAQLAEGARIEGVVTGIPAGSNPGIVAVDVAVEHHSYYSDIAPDGSFFAEGLPAGRYRLAFIDYACDAIACMQYLAEDGAGVFAVEEAETLSGLEFALQTATASASGVISAAGLPWIRRARRTRRCSFISSSTTNGSAIRGPRCRSTSPRRRSTPFPG
jgi:hypothetical protein